MLDEFDEKNDKFLYIFGNKNNILIIIDLLKASVHKKRKIKNIEKKLWI